MTAPIRPLNPLDAAPFHALRLFALQESPTAYGASFEEEQSRPLEESEHLLSEGSGQQFFGAFAQNELVGIVGVGREERIKERHRGFIRSVYVAPAHRGHALAKALMEVAIAFARSQPGLRQLTLDVTAGNVAAITTYQRLGFVMCGQQPQALFVDGHFHDEVNMVLHLV